MNTIEDNRRFLKTYFDDIKDIKTDAAKGLPKPSLIKDIAEDSVLINLPEPSKSILKNENIFDNIKNRRSTRVYSNQSLSISELSYLLWSSCGVSGEDSKGNKKRTVPSAGASYTIETYLIVRNVENLDKGIYRYLPLEHKLEFIKTIEKMQETIESFMLDSKQPFLPGFANKSAVIFVWSTIPYRSEYKFNIMAHKKILIDAGHICQNLCIAGESVNIGTCAIGIYDQDKIDALLGLDGKDEFVIYLASAGLKNLL